MFKFTIVVLMAIACASAKPGGLIAPVAYSSPLVAQVAPAVVTATSSQVFARNYNGLASPLIAAPVAYSAAPLAYSAAPLAYSAYSAPLVARSAYAAAPLIARSAYAAAPLAYAGAPLAYASPVAPLKYTLL